MDESELHGIGALLGSSSHALPKKLPSLPPSLRVHYMVFNIQQERHDQDKTKTNQKGDKEDKGEKGQVATLGIRVNLRRFNTPPQPGPPQSRS